MTAPPVPGAPLAVVSAAVPAGTGKIPCVHTGLGWSLQGSEGGIVQG